MIAFVYKANQVSRMLAQRCGLSFENSKNLRISFCNGMALHAFHNIFNNIFFNLICRLTIKSILLLQLV
jgi:hypothetical protein